MNKKERIKFIIEELEKKYPKVPIPLDHKDPYTLLIAVLLSAQCTDVRVNKITPILFKRADNPYDMVKMSVEEIKDIITNSINIEDLVNGAYVLKIYFEESNTFLTKIVLKK